MTTATEPRERTEGSVDLWLRMYRRMLAIRAFETRVNELYTRALMPGLAHLYIGQEAVAVGVSEALETTDYITSTHRGHGHCLAKGASPGRMFAELLGKEAGYCKGKGGSMHIADPDTGNLGANAIVCGSAGIAIGAGGAELEGGTGSDREYGRLADGGGPGRRDDVRRVAGGGGVRDECGGRVPRWRR